MGGQDGLFYSPGSARQLAFVDNNIHVLGEIDSINGQPMYHWPIFDGNSWMPGDSTEAFDFYTHDAIRYQNELIIAGNFFTSTGIADIAKQGPNGWEQLGTGIYGDPWINSMVEYDGLLWVAGEFYYSPGGNPATGLMVWDGTSWSDPFPQLQRTSQSMKLKVIDDVLWLAAPFTVNGRSGSFSVANYNRTELCVLRGDLHVNAYSLTASTDTLYVAAGPGPHIYSWPLNAPADTCFQLQVGQSELKAADTFSVYPNPTKEALHINLPNGLQGELLVYDETGRLIMRTPAQSTLNLKGFEAGVYLLRFLAAENSFTTRFVVQ